MTGATLAPALGWHAATVRELHEETATVRTLFLEVNDWPGHIAGQHVQVRLPPGMGDGKVRSFSIASAPSDPLIAVTIERLPGGRVSSQLCGDVHAGFQFELRGPFGNRFLWRGDDDRPLFLVAGGSGIAPCMSMLRQRAHVLRSADVSSPPGPRARLLYSARSRDDIIYRDELATLVASDATLGVSYTLTRDEAPLWSGFTGRIDRAMLSQLAWPPSERPRTYVCGPRALVEMVAALLIELGQDPSAISTEPFVATGV